MKNVLLFCFIIIVVLSGIRISEGREKKTAAAPAAAAKAEAKGVWKDVKSNSPEAKVSYKLDGSYIVIRFKNVSKDKSLRIRYQAKWKKNQNGKWIEEASAEGMGVRLKQSEDITKEIRTHSKEIRDVAIEIDVTEG